MSGATDKYGTNYNYNSEFSSAIRAEAVTPSDEDELAEVTRAIFIGGSGNIEVVLRDDTNPVVFKNVVAGSVLPLRVKKVLDNGTTATDIIALY